MIINGSNFTGFNESKQGNKSFKAYSVLTNEYLQGDFHYATNEELQKALQLAEAAFGVYQKTSFSSRAQFLDAIAHEIVTLGDALIERCVAETALPAGRITGERNRTCGQLKLFAQLLRDGWWVDARIDTAQPDRQPLPKADIRRMLIPIGPVAVFGASNFPLAFSTAGGDTASALAAGCPVVVKSHSSHPGTNEMISSAIVRAAQKTGMPEGVFSSLYLSHDDVSKFVQHPAIKAVGFTGSRNVGMLLFQLANSRPQPIPVFAEMSAVNPIVLLEGALKVNGEKIAKDLTTSVTMGVGQFCTNPGLVLLLNNVTGRQFLKSFGAHVATATPASMLNKNICKAYNQGVAQRGAMAEVSLVAKAIQQATTEKYEAQPEVYSVSASTFLEQKDLTGEIFGPTSLVVLCNDHAELNRVLQSLEGQLTATIHATAEDKEKAQPLIDIIIQKAGRIVYGGYPTGVEVCHSMQHGGPFPSTTDGRSTSVGTAAIYRFVRPVAFQDFPDDLLPEPLQNNNPLHIIRLVDGEWSKKNL